MLVTKQRERGREEKKQIFVDTKEKKKHVFQRKIIRNILQDFCTHSTTQTHRRPQAFQIHLFFCLITHTRWNTFLLLYKHVQTLNHTRVNVILKCLETGSARFKKSNSAQQASFVFGVFAVCNEIISVVNIGRNFECFNGRKENKMKKLTSKKIKILCI